MDGHAFQDMSQTFFQVLVEHSLVGIYIFDERCFLYVNRALADLFGYTPQELIGKLGPLDLTHPLDKEKVEESIKGRLFRGRGEEGRHVFRGVHKDGSVVWCEAISRVILYGGRPVIAGSLVDVTRRKVMEEELEAKERYYRTLFEGANDAIFIMDGERFIECNRKTLEIFGCGSKDEIVGSTPFYFSPPFQPDGVASEEKGRRFIKAALEGVPQRFYWRHKRKDGGLLDTEVSLNKVEVGGKTYIQAIVRDITKGKEMERALERSEELYRDLVEKAGLAIFVVDRGGRITYFNRQLSELTGYSEGELKRISLVDWVHPSERDRVLSLFQNFLLGNTEISVQHQYRLVTKEGDIRYVEMSVTPVVEGKETRAFRVYLRDVTERKKMEESLFESRKMEAMGRLAGGIAHDFNNMLMVIMGNCDLILQGIGGAEALLERVKAIREAADRAAALTGQLLAFSRNQVMEPRVLDLNRVVGGMERMLRRLIGEDVDLKVSLAPDLGRVRADPSQMEQIMVNLAVNARDAMPRGGTLYIETFNATVAEKEAMKHPELVPGEYVVLTVRDTGQGMEEGIQTRIFEPFFTTKEKGTGLGLATVYGIVKQMGGHILCRSAPGAGTTFEIYFPRVYGKETGEEKGPLPVGDAVEGKGEVVLVVEDEASVRDVTVSILRSAGYRVLEASGGEEALKVCDKYSGFIHLLVTDVVMPGMSGKRLAQALEARYPGIKVLYISGYTDNIIVRHGVLENGTSFIQKPFTRDQLLRKVREVLEQQTGGP